MPEAILKLQASRLFRVKLRAMEELRQLRNRKKRELILGVVRALRSYVLELWLSTRSRPAKVAYVRCTIRIVGVDPDPVVAPRAPRSCGAVQLA
jgi:hypothetical protein